MHPQSRAIDKQTLLQLARQRLHAIVPNQPEFTVTDVQQRDGVLIFKGEYFLDAQGLPSDKTQQVFNVFKLLATELSPHWHLK
ncbi:hypothetical protein CIG19_03260 [Enterobacterales bacterium CwR94]|nr:hypothetical protein CIG19_03260 [Enterobacterales bacterium CwR94]